jgi:hypothetical protein
LEVFQWSWSWNPREEEEGVFVPIAPELAVGGSLRLAGSPGYLQYCPESPDHACRLTR